VKGEIMATTAPSLTSVQLAQLDFVCAALSGGTLNVNNATGLGQAAAAVWQNLIANDPVAGGRIQPTQAHMVWRSYVLAALASGVQSLEGLETAVAASIAALLDNVVSTAASAGTTSSEATAAVVAAYTELQSVRFTG
jgi:hypothetical protein